MGSALKASKEGVATQEKRARLLERALSDDVVALEAKKAALDQVTPVTHYYLSIAFLNHILIFHHLLTLSFKFLLIKLHSVVKLHW